MSKVLGIDIGTNSLGWAIVDHDLGEIIDLGVRIFPMGVTEKSKESRNKARRDARQIRRGYHRYRIRRQRLTSLLQENGLLPNEPVVYTAKSLYGMRKKALYEKLTLHELGRVLLHLNSRRGFKSNRKTDVKPKESEKENTGMLSQISEFNTKLRSGNYRTAGEYFYSLFDRTEGNDDEPRERIRKRFIGREVYIQEFDLIWENQQKYYPELLIGNKQNSDKSSIYHKIKNECIFYQRPLKSQKHLVSKCEFEPNKRVALKNSFEFQEFRIWQKLYDLKVNTSERTWRFLDNEERVLLFNHLNVNEKISQTKVTQILNIKNEKNVEYNDVIKQLKGNITNSAFITALGEKTFFDLSNEEKQLLLDTLNFYWDSDKLKENLTKKFQFTTDQIELLTEIKLEPDYGSLSSKALKKILPFMRDGQNYSEAAKSAGYHHSHNAETQGKDREIHEYIEQLKPNELRNPIVQQSVSETIKVVNAIVRQHGALDEIHIEMARELKKNKEQRDTILRKNREQEERRKELAEFLSTKNSRTIYPTDTLVSKLELWLEMGCEKDKDDEFREFVKKGKNIDKQKYRLWLECNRISPYSGRIISFTELLSPEIEIEHIIPYSRSMDNSFFNKTLCERHINDAKGNRTPLEYFANRPKEEFEVFKKNISVFSVEKRQHFLAENVSEDFDPNQLTNTGYIAKQVKNKIMEICRNVTITNGQVTGKLRQLWGLNTIVNPLGENKKSRDDHRHHAVDALVIASTTRNHVNVLSRYSSFDEKGKLKNPEIYAPWPTFRDEAESLVAGILVSHKNDKKVVDIKPNKIKIRNGTVIQKAVGVRDALHQETVYAQIQNGKSKQFAVRKNIENLDGKSIENIVDERIRNIVRNHFDHFGKDAPKHPVFSNEKLGIPIHHVRVLVNENPIPLYPESQNKKFVLLGNNHHVALYKDKKGKTVENMVSFYHAVKRANYGLPIVIRKPSEVWDMTLKKGIQNELFLEQLPDPSWEYQYYMKINDMFLFNIDPNEIDINDPVNKEVVARNLYRVWKLSKGKYHFNQQTVSKPEDTVEAKISGKTIQVASSTIKAIKVKIDILGRLVKENN